MAKALFSFDDRRAAQRAAVALVELGLPADDVVVHGGEAARGEPIRSEIDELATGGFVSNLDHLLHGLFAWGSTADEDIGEWQDVVRRGGAVLSVETHSNAEQERVDDAMREAGCARRTDWRDSPAA